jgi:hypothetical protein
LDFSAAPHARIESSRINTSHALANKTGAVGRKIEKEKNGEMTLGGVGQRMQRTPF